jgi:hypothetical protein
MPLIDLGALGLLKGQLVFEISYSEHLALNYGLQGDVLVG